MAYQVDRTFLLTIWRKALIFTSNISDFRLPVTLQTNALLGSFAAQAEFGDAADSPEYSNYLVHAKIAPNMNEQLAQAIAELHKQHK